MKIDDKVVTMTGDEFEIFSRLIETVNSQEKNNTRTYATRKSRSDALSGFQ